MSTNQTTQPAGAGRQPSLEHSIATAKTVHRYTDAIVADLQRLIQIPSVKGPSAPGAPFGVEPRRALDFVLQRAAELGFATENVDGYAGHVQYGTTGPLIAVLAHLDVVPAGEGWVHPAFGGVIDDGKIFGRGASDNKGPAIAALYCLKAFADAVPEPQVRIRLIYGTDEESGFGCMDHYFKHQPVPDMGFSPDAQYPLFNREMGIVNAYLRTPRSGRRLIATAAGGEALNMVANVATATVLPQFAADAEATGAAVLSRSIERRCTLERTGAGQLLTAKGISAHGGTPAAGVSAIAHLVHALVALADGIEGAATTDAAPFEPQIRALAGLIGFETRGESLGIACRDGESGELSVNWGRLIVDNEQVEVGLNLRYPVTADYAAISAALTATAARAGFAARFEHHLPPLFVPESDPLIQTLLSVYRAISGDTTGAMSMSGGTYARVLNNHGVCFGAGFAGTDGRAHRSDEFVIIDELRRHSEICTAALFELARSAQKA